MKNRVAILIPTYNRIDFILRTISYYASIKSKHPIFIGDASKKSSEYSVLEAAKGVVDVHYFHWVKTNENSTIRKTIARLAREASSDYKYCAFQGDDDYFVSESLSRCADFLDVNLSYATAQGDSAVFRLDRSGPYGNIQYMYPYFYKNPELLGDTALSRLIEITDNYWVLNFSVHRTDELIEDILNGSEDVIDRSFGEAINSLSMAIRGKSKYIDCLYLVRNGHDRIVEHKDNIDWITTDNWHNSFESVVDSLSILIQETDKLSDNDSYVYTRNAVKTLLNNKFTTTQQTMLITFLKMRLGKNTLLLIKNIRRIVYLMRVKFSCSDFTLECVTSNKSRYHSDFLPILDSVKNNTDL